MNALVRALPALDPSSHVVITRAFTPVHAAERMNAYRAARSLHRDDHEFARAHRRGLRMQQRICARPSVLGALFPRREAATAGTDPPASFIGTQPQG